MLRGLLPPSAAWLAGRASAGTLAGCCIMLLMRWSDQEESEWEQAEVQARVPGTLGMAGSRHSSGIVGSSAAKHQRLPAGTRLAYLLSQLAYWAAAGRAAGAVLGAAFRAGPLRLPIALLGDMAVLPHLLLLLLSLERWAWHAVVDVAVAAGGLPQLPRICRLLPPDPAACWPLEICCRGLQLAAVKVSGQGQGGGP